MQQEPSKQARQLQQIERQQKPECGAALRKKDGAAAGQLLVASSNRSPCPKRRSARQSLQVLLCTWQTCRQSCATELLSCRLQRSSSCPFLMPRTRGAFAAGLLSLKCLVGKSLLLCAATSTVKSASETLDCLATDGVLTHLRDSGPPQVSFRHPRQPGQQPNQLASEGMQVATVRAITGPTRKNSFSLVRIGCSKERYPPITLASPQYPCERPCLLSRRICVTTEWKVHSD